MPWKLTWLAVLGSVLFVVQVVDLVDLEKPLVKGVLVHVSDIGSHDGQ